MRRYYTKKSDVKSLLKKITEAQQKANNFCNVSVKPYRGTKHDPEDTVVVVVG